MSDTGIIKRTRRYRHIPTPESRERVVMLKMVGSTDETIGRVMGLSVQCLTKWYRTELETGRASMLADIASTLIKKALDGDVTAAIFILKTRAKWSEKIEIDNLNQPGVLIIDTSDKRTMDDYTDEELLAIINSETKGKVQSRPGKEPSISQLLGAK